MSSDAETETRRAGSSGRSVSALRRRIPPYPVDYYCERPVSKLQVNARCVYIVDRDDPESVRGQGDGLHCVRGDQETIVVESDDRLFIEPAGDCVLEYAAGRARVFSPDDFPDRVNVGVKAMPRRPISTGPGTEALFRCLSAVCSRPAEASPYRSHPFFRAGVPDICISPVAGPGPMSLSPRGSLGLRLPPDLRYLYAAAPLSFYLGAYIEMGRTPSADIGRVSIDLPGRYEQFERWAGQMLSRTFQMDRAVRYSAATGENLSGIDVCSITGYAPEELMLMGMADRFQLYLKALRAGSRAFHSWHLASYVDPVPASAEVLPCLMRSLSAVYAPRSAPLSERDVVTLSARSYRARTAGMARGRPGTADSIVLPSMYDAQAQQWFLDGCPVDAALSSLDALRNSRKYARSRLVPSVCVICNEDAMAREARLLRDLLDGIAAVDLRAGLDRRELRHTFTEGFDVVHYAGHCERDGLKCRDGYADLSGIPASNVPVFFLNSCFSYVQGARLVEKGSACGIATMFRLLDEAALDVCAGFYRMLARGYTVMASWLGARECSVAGKEYLLIGDGSYTVFNGGSGFLPIYRLGRAGSGFTLRCDVPGGSKGLIARSNDGPAVPDTGYMVTGLKAADLQGHPLGPDGMCLYGGHIYDDVASAGRAALADICRAAGPSLLKSTCNESVI